MAEEQGYQTIPLTSWTKLAVETGETNPDLMWPRSIKVYDKMRREDSQIGSVLRGDATHPQCRVDDRPGRRL